jgi:hypothetical protein
LTSLTSRDLPVAKAVDQMIVHHTNCLHEGVTDRRADEFKSAFRQVLVHGVGFGRSSRNLPHAFELIANWLVVDEAPDVGVEIPKLFLHSEKGFSVLDRGGDFEPVAHDAGIGEELFDLSRVVFGDFFCVEIIKRLTIVIAFIQDCGPTQSGLRAFENEEFEQEPVIMDGDAPFFVVVGDHGFGCCPTATRCHWQVELPDGRENVKRKTQEDAARNR